MTSLSSTFLGGGAMPVHSMQSIGVFDILFSFSCCSNGVSHMTGSTEQCQTIIIKIKRMDGSEIDTI